MRHVFKAAAATEEMLLTGVMAEDVRRLLISSGLSAPGPDLVDQVVAITAGNPLFIVELARHLTLGGPDRPEVPLPRTLGDLVRYRLDALPESGRRVLGAASILGERFRVGDLARALGLDAALIARQLVRSGPDDVGELGELADQMLAVSASTGRADLEMWGRLWRIDTHWYAGRLPAIASETAGLQRCAERAGGPYARWHLLSTRGMLALARAEFDDGQRIFGEAVELLTRIDHPAVHGASVAFGLLLGHHRGHSVELLDASAWDFGADVRWDLFSRLARAFVLVDDGQLDEAAALYNRCGDPANWAIPSGGRLVALAIAARVATSLGALDDVAKLGKWLVPYRGRFVAAGGGSGNFLGPVDLALGRCSASLGHYDAARRDLEAAGTMCRTVGAPGFGVEADTELAAVHARVGDNAAAAVVARRAQPLARILGMTPWADGLATFAGRDAHIDPLTAREREIASLVAAGLSNRAIADRLVISDRTAQNHVQHILGKLGFTNRAQIAAWASRQSQ
jgi:DNA-binding CsgD family transcriptional regulator